MNYNEFFVKAITLGESKSTYKLYMVSANQQFAIVIIIGYYEAQLIAIAADKSQKTKRPLTHELFAKYMSRNSQEVEKIQVYRLETGTFYSEILVQDADTQEFMFTLDARLSDAIAMALRFDAPIYISDQVMEGAGVSLNEMENNPIMEVQNESNLQTPEEADVNNYESINDDEFFMELEDSEDDFSNFSLDDLHEMLNDAIEMNISELIEKLNAEISKRNTNFN